MAKQRKSSLEMNSGEFKETGMQLLEKISGFINSFDNIKVTPGESPGEIQKVIGSPQLPQEGKSAKEIILTAADLLFSHSLFNGHPKFMGYVTSSAAPIGALADLLSSSVNPNVGANILSPAATEIEKQTIKWLAELVGLRPSYGGILVSGGNMANFTAFLAARTAMAPGDIKEKGLKGIDRKMVLYCSEATHTWVEKAAGLFGLGSEAIRWIKVTDDNKIDTGELELKIKADLSEKGLLPFLVVGNAGDVSTGAVDDLRVIGAICKKYNLWFHVDGAYGLPAAIVPEFRPLFDGIDEADSVAIDPHKWLYAPLEAGCTLVKDPATLVNTFSSHPVYYRFDENDGQPVTNFYEYGFQNSRGFRALKVWAALQQAGINGYREMISEDIRLAGLLAELAGKHPELESVTCNLSISTMRYVPLNADNDEEYLNRLNESLLNELQKGGRVFLSNAVIKGKFCLRACIVNFRTTENDIEEIIEIIANEGKKVHDNLQKMVAAT